MNIEFVHVRNFRKLKDCRIELTGNQTLFVGANNSGKTTAMDALILFLKLRNKFTTRDFTLSNWSKINDIGKAWSSLGVNDTPNFDIEQWVEHLPSLDIWLKVEPGEFHYIHQLIPTLGWTNGRLGVRLRYEPIDREELYKVFTAAHQSAEKLVEKHKDNTAFSIWPVSLWDFLDEKNNLNAFFKIHTYLLDPQLHETPQALNPGDQPIDGDPFKGIIKIDIINAQRGFSDVNSDGVEGSGIKNLSGQLRSYYDKHLNPSLNPSEHDVDALKAINDARILFDKNLKESFSASLSELEILNYPGFGNPKINLSSRFNTIEGLNHESAVQYSLEDGLSLPEKYNGLGYQNLISILFKLIRFRDEWMQVGKSYTPQTGEDSVEFEPLHLVLIEEPEAHLHAQVQQVFINKAYEILRNNTRLKNIKTYTTQLVISTHSNHIAHEAKFTSLRYFKRSNPLIEASQTTTVINLSKTFGEETETSKFATRYLKTTHCDLFFADAVILVEGPAEKILVPSFIKRHEKLHNCYISLLEIGGSHAHTLRPLIENIGIVTLVITDLDSIGAVGNNGKVQPEKGKALRTGNDTLKTWLPKLSDLDQLLELPDSDKQDDKGLVRVAYQTAIKFGEDSNSILTYPYTFEDSLVLTNKTSFSALTETKGLLKQMAVAAQITDPKQAAEKLFDAITAKGAKKAEFALELLYYKDPELVTVPKYISDGLAWLENKLVIVKTGLQILN